MLRGFPSRPRIRIVHVHWKIVHLEVTTQVSTPTKNNKGNHELMEDDHIVYRKLKNTT